MGTILIDNFDHLAFLRVKDSDYGDLVITLGSASKPILVKMFFSIGVDIPTPESTEKFFIDILIFLLRRRTVIRHRQLDFTTLPLRFHLCMLTLR